MVTRLESSISYRQGNTLRQKLTHTHTCKLHYITDNDPEDRTWLCPLMWTQHHTSSLFAALPAAVWSTLEAESAAQS